jgi:hypothetical protein
MADEDEIEAPQVVDVAGQIGGPSPEEQARVDAEQKALIDQINAEREPAEMAERQAMNAKIERAIAADAARRSLIERVKLLEARVAALENRP